MMQQTLSFPVNKLCNADSYINESSRIRKRKLSFPAPVGFKETRMMTNKKRKKGMRLLKKKNTSTNRDFSIDLDLPDISNPCSEDGDIFDWIENMLGKGNGETSNAIPTTMLQTENKDKNISGSSQEADIDSFLTLNESDPCYEDMIALLAEGDNDDNNDENVFKKIQESFVSDRFLEHQPKLKRSLSFNTRVARSSRIVIREGLDQLVKANRQTATTRQMLLNCQLPSSCKKNSQ
jgi:hypothetical protein